MDDVADVLVVGAGPAGATAAIAALCAHPGADVRLLDAAEFPRDKACGDGIAPHALAELAELGVAGLDVGYGPVPWLDVRSPGGVVMSVRPRRPNRVIPRRVFDARLVEAAERAGAVLVRHRARRLQVLDDRVVVDGVHAGRVLIGADGANSVVRRALGVPRNPDAHLALAVRGYAAEHGASERFSGDRTEPTQWIDLLGQDWPAYSWSFPLADGTGRANVGYGRLRRRVVSRADLHAELARLLPGRPAADLRAHHLPLSTWRPRQIDGPVLLAGDAASLINPLTGEGIFYAVRSGRLAGEAAAAAVLDGDPRRAGAAYRRALRASLGRHLRHTALIARLARRPALMDAAMRVAGGRPALAEALVDLGLGDGLIPAGLLPRVVLEAVRAR